MNETLLQENIPILGSLYAHFLFHVKGKHSNDFLYQGPKYTDFQRHWMYPFEADSHEISVTYEMK